MDPLSAYRAMAPALCPAALPGGSEDLVAKIIPRGELDKLSSSVLQPNVATPNLSPSAGMAPGSAFQGFLGNMVNEVSAKQAAAGDAMKQVMGGGNIPLHQAMIAVQEASVSFQLMVEVRNKLLESYQELMRMQV
jgi:flagellar hook-basal body complex protein FliE